MCAPISPDGKYHYLICWKQLDAGVDLSSTLTWEKALVDDPTIMELRQYLAKRSPIGRPTTADNVTLTNLVLLSAPANTSDDDLWLRDINITRVAKDIIAHCGSRMGDMYEAIPDLLHDMCDQYRSLTLAERKLVVIAVVEEIGGEGTATDSIIRTMR